MGLKIWQRYFLSEFYKIFFLFICSFYALYVLIDYSSKNSLYHSVRFSFGEVSAYYFFIFILRADILIPFAILIASIKTLTRLNIQHELIAFMAAGIPLKNLLRPFFYFTFCLTVLLFLNNEFLLPKIMQGLQQIEDAHFSEKYKQEKKNHVKKILLEDSSILLYHRYDSNLKEFYDVFWIESVDKILHLKSLSFETNPPIGHFVDVFKRNDKNELGLEQSIEKMPFPSLQIKKKVIQESMAEPHHQSITRLFKKLFLKTVENNKGLSEQEAKMMTAFARKTAMPWLCLLGFMAVAPFCLVFTRQLPIFIIYLCCMFGIVAFYLLINAATIIGESQVLHPLMAIWLPFALFFVFFGWRYKRCC